MGQSICHCISIQSESESVSDIIIYFKIPTHMHSFYSIRFKSHPFACKHQVQVYILYRSWHLSFTTSFNIIFHFHSRQSIRNIRKNNNNKKSLLSTNDNLHLTHYLRVFILICAKKKKKKKWINKSNKHLFKQIFKILWLKWRKKMYF